ncbi:MAG: dephospho-CoA kinase [Bacteroidales bacterium]|nr:dephospho-CoA kinase [Bacteroidales bacterium]HNT92726.1 dephospho-CoA kinase [Bacteroidales bacterium]HOO67269.1 dephospho-CoA kinase [Bacteroidales bacterium]HPE23151.1 dephospho-CoA kinase [Bacteroidales bacterium]HPJ05861.1 dephospho-CoA kinase [Bacteroidales bacterium]
MARRLGVTGGIGSGKTTVCRIFRVLGIPVFVADVVARDLMNNNEDVRSEINLIAGKDLYSSGMLDRKELASLIFNRPDLLRRVNAAVHPSVLSLFDEWADSEQVPYVIMESAILFEAGADSLVDRVVTISAPVEERISRVMGRNDLTREEVIRRINNQLEDEEREEQSYYIINNADNEMIIPEVLKIHEDMLRLAAKGR